MRKPRKLAPTILGLAIGLTLVGGCGDESNTSAENPTGSCVARVEFDGRTYVDRGSSNDKPATKGRKLGEARPLPCSISDASGSGEGYSVFEAVGFDPDQAVIVEPGLGLMMLATTEESN